MWSRAKVYEPVTEAVFAWMFVLVQRNILSHARPRVRRSPKKLPSYGSKFWSLMFNAVTGYNFVGDLGANKNKMLEATVVSILNSASSTAPKINHCTQIAHKNKCVRNLISNKLAKHANYFMSVLCTERQRRIWQSHHHRKRWNQAPAALTFRPNPLRLRGS